MTNLFWKRNTLILCRDLLSSIGWLFGFPPSLAKTNCTSRFAKSSFWKDSPTFLELFHTKTISNSNRSLFHLFSSPKINNEVIRPRGHDNVVTLSSQRPVVGRFIFLELFFFRFCVFDFSGRCDVKYLDVFQIELNRERFLEKQKAELRQTLSYEKTEA